MFSESSGLGSRPTAPSAAGRTKERPRGGAVIPSGYRERLSFRDYARRRLAHGDSGELRHTRTRRPPLARLVWAWPFFVVGSASAAPPGDTTTTVNANEASPPDASESVVLVEGQVFDFNGGGVKDVQVILLPPDAPVDAAPLAATQTNAYGDFRLTGAESHRGSFVLVFTRSGYAEHRRPVEIVAGEPPPFVDFEMPGDLSFAGVIVRKLDGRPLAGARVTVQLSGREWTDETGADGEFRLEHLVPGRGILLVAAEAHARHKVKIELPATDQPPRIELAPERQVEIVATDVADKPVAETVVEVLDEAREDYQSGVTDAEGQVVFRGISFEAKTLHLRVTHPEFVSDAEFSRTITLPTSAPDPSEGVAIDSGPLRSRHVLRLESAGIIRGTVTHRAGGAPLHGVRVTVGAAWDMNPPRAWTGLDGVYVLKGVVPADSTVSIYLSGYAPEVRTIPLVAGETVTVDFVTQPAKTAAGVVVDPQGAPVPTAHVRSTGWRGTSVLAVEALTDRDGRFELGSLPEDEFEVTVRAPGMIPAMNERIVPGKSDHRIELKTARSTQLRVGDPCPDLELVTLDGRTITTVDLRGKRTLLDFWATWCGPCVAETPNLVHAYEAFRSRDDFQIISISLDADADEARFRRFVTDKKMAWTHVFGSRGRAEDAAERCGVTGIPQTFLIGPDGKIESTGILGPSLTDNLRKYIEK